VTTKYAYGELVIITSDDECVTATVHTIFPHFSENFLYILKTDDGANHYRYEAALRSATVDLTELVAM